MSISAPLIKWSIFSATSISIILSWIYLWHSWHLRKRSILSGWRSTGNSKTVKNPQSGEFSLLNPLCTVRKSTANKVPISDYTFNFVSAVSTSFVSLWASQWFPSSWNVTLSFALIFLIWKLLSTKCTLI